jgi:hypothetical protein
LRSNSGQNTLIMGSAALDFELGFNGNVLDDPRLGYHSGKTPGFIVVGSVDYAEFFRDYEKDEPSAYKFIVNRLANEYRLVYDYAGNRIYARR